MMTVMMVIIIVTATVPRIGPSIRWPIIAIAVPVVAVAIVIAGCTTTTASAEGSSRGSRSRSGSRRVPVTVVIIRIARIECWRSRGFIHWRLLCRFPRWCSSSRSLLYSGWMTRHNDSGWDDWFVHQRVLLLLIWTVCQNSASVVILSSSHLVNFWLLLLFFSLLLLLLLFVLFAFRGFSCDINK